MGTFDRQRARIVAAGIGGLGLLLSLAIEADVVLSSGLWYPVVYAGAPALTATAAFASERPAIGPIRLLAVTAWLLASSVLALAAAVAFSVGATPGVTEPSAIAALVGVLLYLGFLIVPTGLAMAAARTTGIRTVFLLIPSPVLQAAIAWILIAAL